MSSRVLRHLTCIKIPHGIHVELESQCVQSTTPQTYLTLERKAPINNQPNTHQSPANVQPFKTQKATRPFSIQTKTTKSKQCPQLKTTKTGPFAVDLLLLSFFLLGFLLSSRFFFPRFVCFFVICLKSFYFGVCTCFLFVEIECKKLEIYVFLNSRFM